MTDKAELRRLAQAVAGWSNCNKAWRNPDEDEVGAVVGHVDGDDNMHPVATVDCEQYYSDDSLALAEFYAAANPAAVLSLLDEIERLRTVFNAAKRVLDADKLPFSESRAQFDGAMTLLERAVEAATKADRGGE